jgi:predicted dehydrogenase
MEAIARMTGPFRVTSRDKLDEQLGRPATEMEFQMRNWLHFGWLSGDAILELLIHNIDHCLWASGALPQKAHGRWERSNYTHSNYGDTSDFLSAHFTFDKGIEMDAEVSALAANATTRSVVQGDQGVATVPDRIVNPQGKVIWNYSGRKTNPYQEEMNQWCASIRNGAPLNTMDSAADSTLTAIMGRTAAYTGREVTWTEMLEGGDVFFSNNPVSLNDEPPTLPDKYGDYLTPPQGIRS